MSKPNMIPAMAANPPMNYLQREKEGYVLRKEKKNTQNIHKHCWLLCLNNPLDVRKKTSESCLIKLKSEYKEVKRVY
jgi:hypothetical protein